MPRQPEGKLAQKILTALREEGGWWTKIHGGEFQAVGLPDIIGCYKGYFIGIEVKLPGEKPTARQRWVLNQIGLADGTATVVTSVEEALEVLSEFREGE